MSKSERDRAALAAVAANAAPQSLALCDEHGEVVWSNVAFDLDVSADARRDVVRSALDVAAAGGESSVEAGPYRATRVNGPDADPKLWLLSVALTAAEPIAERDGLTGLASRAELQGRLDDWTGQAGPDRFALVFLDVDDFKTINDGHGHLQGDATLREIAARIAGEVRAEDFVARFGGDEFIVLLRGLGPGADWRHVEQRLRAKLADDYDVAGSPRGLPCSIGVAFFDRRVGATPEELIAAADRAMYASKRGEPTGEHAGADPTLP